MTPSKELILNLARKYPWRIVLNIILGFSGALFNGVSTALIVPVLLTLLGQQAILKNGPPVIQTLLSPFNRLPEEYRLIAMALVIILVIILKNLTTYVSSLANSSFSRTLTAELQEQGLKVLLDVDLDFFSKAKAGDLMNRLGGEMSRTTTSITGVISLSVNIITIFVFLMFLLAISWQLTILATLILPLSALITQTMVARSKEYGKVVTAISQEYSGGLIEIFSAIRLVKATGNEQKEFSRFKRLIREREKVDFESRKLTDIIAPLGEIVNIIALFILVLVGRTIFAGQLESLSAVLLTYMVILFRLLPYVSQLNGIRSSLARSAASLEVVYDLLRRDNKAFMGSGTRPYTSFKEGIRFEHLAFAYPDSSEMVLEDVNLFLPKGTTLALVGSSGAGKSTLADLLPRFYDPTAGQITIDGVDLREFDLSSFRHAMGIVSQDTFLFNDSVRNNIAYGCTDVTDEDVVAAVKRANAYEFIQRLPMGLDTPIGDRGVMLSGGQRQRLAIARALLKNPEILILDEATSALDTVSERLVQQALDELSRERTTLVIAHRLSTVRKANQIAVMERGRVVEVGTHDELLERNGQYSRLYMMQFAETAQEEASKADAAGQLSKASYDFRARLNTMIGSLGLLADGLVDTPEEQNELAEEAYRSALELFQTVRQLEEAAALTTTGSKAKL